MGVGPKIHHLLKLYEDVGGEGGGGFVNRCRVGEKVIF